MIIEWTNHDSSWSVYLGVNDKKVDYVNTNLKGQAEYEYGVEWGLGQPEYLKSNTNQDIGLLKLDRDAVMETEFVQPICPQVWQVWHGGGCGGHRRVNLGLGQALVHLQHQRVWSSQEPQVQATVQVWQENLLQVCYK